MSDRRFVRSLAAFCCIQGITLAEVVVGAPADSQNCIPFGCATDFGITHYQQLYAASAFPDAFLITGLTFFNTFPPLPPPNVNPPFLSHGGNFSISLSTVSDQVNSFFQLIPDGSDNTLLFSGSLDSFSVPNPSSFTLGGGHYFYDPTNGNLLLDVLISGSPTFGGYLDARGSNPTSEFSRATNGSNGGTVGFGLVTEFESVPEPSSLIVVLMAGLGIIARSLFPDIIARLSNRTDGERSP